MINPRLITAHRFHVCTYAGVSRLTLERILGHLQNYKPYYYSLLHDSNKLISEKLRQRTKGVGNTPQSRSAGEQAGHTLGSGGIQWADGCTDRAADRAVDRGGQMTDRW